MSARSRAGREEEEGTTIPGGWPLPKARFLLIQCPASSGGEAPLCLPKAFQDAASFSPARETGKPLLFVFFFPREFPW